MIDNEEDSMWYMTGAWANGNGEGVGLICIAKDGNGFGYGRDNGIYVFEQDGNGRSFHNAAGGGQFFLGLLMPS
jgi:hypothetical protein